MGFVGFEKLLTGAFGLSFSVQCTIGEREDES